MRGLRRAVGRFRMRFWQVSCLALLLSSGPAHAALIEIVQAQSSTLQDVNTGAALMTFERYAGPGQLVRVDGIVQYGLFTTVQGDTLFAGGPTTVTVELLLSGLSGDGNAPGALGVLTPIPGPQVLATQVVAPDLPGFALGPLTAGGTQPFDFTNPVALSQFIGNTSWGYAAFAAVTTGIDNVFVADAVTTRTQALASMLLRYTVRVPDPVGVPAPFAASLLLLAVPALVRRRAGRSSRQKGAA